MNKINPFLRRCPFLLVLALMVALDSAAQRFEPRIVFESNRNGNWDIYAMDVNGNNLLQLTDNPTDDRRPACSPDGTKIAFTSFRAGKWDIYTMDTDGTNLMRLTNNEISESSPSWSPDGSRIAFDSWRNNGDIYVMTANGKRLTRLTEGKGNNWSPSYSSDGTRIVFVSDRDGNYDIYIMDTDGRGAVKLTKSHPGVENKSPHWMPGFLPVSPHERTPTFWGTVKRKQ